ncbi:MFS transporter [Scopulibacillus cellulosilyticus]|uniref:MFS transporter n=1 Tax=Scopulibacillus cellulosilyticus TaxID=2665665 RepID=A0ABW2PVC2_9BACL
MSDDYKTDELDPVIYKSQSKKAAIASTIGTTVEWYDYFVYGTASAMILPQLFFPGSNPYIGTLESFATFFLGFLARPIGAAVFGHYGDKIGRKATLIITLLLMGFSTMLIGLMPTYGTIGFWAPLILIILRVIQGIGVGGEWGGSVLLSMEWANKKKRGLMASWPQMGVSFGLFLSSVVFTLFINITGNHFNTWGWRIPFLLSSVLVVIGLVIRLSVMETPHFRKVQEEKKIARQPLIEVVKNNRREIILSTLLRLGENAPFYIFVTFVISYGTEHLHMGRQFLVNATMAASLVSLFTIPFFGYLSDIIGRKRMYMIGAILTLLWAFPYYGLLNTSIPVLAIIAVIFSLIPHDMMYGSQGALIAELFPAKVRYSGASLGYQLTSIIGGGPAPLIATYLLHTYGGSVTISIYVIITAIISIIATALVKNRSKQVDLQYERREISR